MSMKYDACLLSEIKIDKLGFWNYASCYYNCCFCRCYYAIYSMLTQVDYNGRENYRL